ncbi:MAG: hypothetical protein J6L99_05665 [Ruminococcus sp.]|nr:hypothetical protein [Ruminococcus sp.]
MDEMNNNLDTNDVVSGVENVTSKGGKKVAAVTAGVIAVAAAGGGAAYACSDYVKNQVKLLVCKPDSYYTWVNEENAEDFAEKLAAHYTDGIARIDAGSSVSMAMQYDLSDTAKELLKEEVGDDETTSAIVDNLNSIALGIDAQVKKGDAQDSIYLNWNEDRLVTVDAAIQDGGNLGFFRIPELTEKWACLDIESLIGEVPVEDDEAAKKLEEALTKFVADPAEYLTADELKSEIVKYVGVWNKSTSDVTLEKKADVNICDISVEYTIATVEITDEKAKEICKTFCEEIKNDDVIKGVIVDKLEAVSEEDYNSAIDDVLSNIEENTESSDDTLSISTYIDPKGVIRGMSAKFNEDDMSFIFGRDGDQVRAEFFITEDGEEQCRAELTAAEAENKYSGNIDMSADDETVSIEFTNFEIVDEKLGTFNAETTFIIPDEEQFAIKFSADGNTQNASADIEVEGENYGTLMLTMTIGDSASPEIPDKASAFLIDEEFDIDALKEYVTEDEMNSFIASLLTKMGMTDDNAKSIGDMAASSIYEENSGYDYDYDYDDDEFEFDMDDDSDDIDIDDEVDDLDLDDFSFDDKYADDMVRAESGQAYMAIADSDLEALYMGMGYESLSYKAGVADIKGDGSYTVSVTADTDGYKEATDNTKPNGVYCLGVVIEGVEGMENAEAKVTSIKFDGKDYPLTSDAICENYNDEYSIIIYADDYTEENSVDLSDIGEWTTAEVTFEVKGLK